MKKIISILLTALAAFGCAKEELPVLETSRIKEVPSGIGMSPINFAFSKGAENWGTKAGDIDGGSLPAGATLSVFADVNEAGTQIVANYLNNAEYDNSGKPADTGVHFYWPESDNGVTLDFYFVYPYDSERTISSKSFDYTIDYSDTDNQEDLLVASSLNTAVPSSPDGRVSVTMNHALSLLAFEAIAEDSGEEYTVDSITISNESGFSNSGTYDFSIGSDGGWKDLSGSITSLSSSFTNKTVASSNYTAIYDCFLLPQEVASMSISVTYSKSGTTYSNTKVVTPDSKTFEKGKRYIYGIKLPAISSSSLPSPKVFLTSRSDNFLEFGWAPVEGATGYEVSTDGGNNYSSIGSNRMYKWEGRSKNTTYTIYVRATGSGGKVSEAAYLTEKTTNKGNGSASPMIVSAEATSTTIMVAWNEVTSANNFCYEISLNPSFSDFKQVQRGDGTCYLYTGLAPNKSYTVYIRTNDWNGNYSEVTSIRVNTTSGSSSGWSWNGCIGGNNNNGTITTGSDATSGSGIRITYYYNSDATGASFKVLTGGWSEIKSVPVSRSPEAQTFDLMFTDISKDLIANKMVISTNGVVFVTHIEVIP